MRYGSTQPTRVIQTHGSTCKHNIPFILHFFSNVDCLPAQTTHFMRFDSYHVNYLYIFMRLCQDTRGKARTKSKEIQCKHIGYPLVIQIYMGTRVPIFYSSQLYTVILQTIKVWYYITKYNIIQHRSRRRKTGTAVRIYIVSHFLDN